MSGVVIAQAGLELEMALLGRLFMAPQDRRSVSWLQPEHFAEPLHARLYSWLTTAEMISPILASAAIGEHPTLNELERARYIERLMGVSCGSWDLQQVARLIIEHSRRRLLQQTSLDLYEDAASDLPATEALGRHWRALTEIASSSASGGLRLRSAQEVARDVIAGIGQQTSVMPTGLPSLDRALNGGMALPGVMAFSARPGFGKSLMLMTIALQANAPTAFYALEMGDVRIMQRMLGSLGEFNSSLLRLSTVDPKLVQAAERAAQRLPERLWFADRAGIKFTELKSEWSELAVTRGIKLFVLDYFQLVRPDQPTENRAGFLDELGQWLHEFAKTHNVVVLTASQENRVGFLREGDGLQNACDNLYSIHLLENPMFCPSLGACKNIWLKSVKGRDGAESVGSEESSPLVISPLGPAILDFGA